MLTHLSPSQRYAAGLALVVVAALSWSTAGIFPRLVSTDIYHTLFWRSLLGGFSVVLIFALMYRPSSWRDFVTLNRAELILTLIGSVSMIGYVASFYFANIATVTFVYGSLPIMTMVLSALILRTSVHKSALICALLMVGGMGIIVWGQTHSSGLLGVVIALAVTLLFALYTIAIKRLPQANMIKSTYSAAFLAAILMLPMLGFGATTSITAIATQELVWLGLYGFLNIGVGFACFFIGVRLVSPVTATLVGMIETPLAPIWAYLLFQEQPSAQTMIGGAVVFLSALAYVRLHVREG